MTRAERWLALMLRATGVVLMLAAPSVVAPRAWHAAGHRALGFGPYPDGPVIDYLVRSISLMYAVSGVFCWMAAGRLRTSRWVIRFLGVFSVGFGSAMLAIDAAVGLPWPWTAAEGPGAIGLGVVLLALLRHVPEATRRSAEPERAAGDDGAA